MLLDLLPAELRSLLLAASVERRFRDGETIHHRADRRRSLSIVRSGAVRIETTGADGVVRAMALLSPGHSFGEITVVAGLPRANDAVAVGPTIVADVEEAAFHRLLADHPAFGKALLISTTLKLRRAAERANDLSRLPLEARLAKHLLLLSGMGQGEIVRQSQTVLATALWVSRVSLGKALGALRKKGLVETGYGRIVIRDRGRIERWLDAGADPEATVSPPRPASRPRHGPGSGSPAATAPASAALRSR